MADGDFIDPYSVAGVAKVDQDMARIKQTVSGQEPAMVEAAVKEMLRLEKHTFNALLSLSLRTKGTGATDSELDKAMHRLPKVAVPTAEGWLISMLAIYGWNRMAEEIANARKMDAGILPD